MEPKFDDQWAEKAAKKEDQQQTIPDSAVSEEAPQEKEITSESVKKEATDVSDLDSFEQHVTDLSKEAEGLEDSKLLDVFLSKDENELVPWEPVTLPSLGQFYDGRVPGGVVEVRPMDIYVEKIMSTQRFVRTGQAIDMMFKHCVRFPDPEFDIADLLSGDGTFLLYYLRGITHGNLYEFMVTCGNEDCQYKMSKTFDLNQLQTTIKNPSPEDKEPFECELPYCSAMFKKPFKVGIRLIRRRDLLQMTNTGRVNTLVEPARVKTKLSRKFRQVQTVQSVDDFIERNLGMVIVHVMGNEDRFKIKQFVSKLHATDAAAIREKLVEVSPGVDTTIEITCPECGNVMDIALPITESFFRRTVSR